MYKTIILLHTLRVNVPKVMECSTKTSFWEHARGAAGASCATLSGVIDCYSDPPSTRAGGQDDVSLNKLPQIICFVYIYDIYLFICSVLVDTVSACFLLIFILL